MIKYVEGDILLSQAKALAHGIAPNDDFKNGLALSLREQWPAMYKDMRHFCHETAAKPGTIWAWAGSNGKWVVNLFTQEAPAHAGAHAGPAHLEYVNHALKALKEWAIQEKIESLALPKLATGVGRLSWDEVKPVIEKQLGELKIPVYVYLTYKKGIKALEGQCGICFSVCTFTLYSLTKLNDWWFLGLPALSTAFARAESKIAADFSGVLRAESKLRYVRPNPNRYMHSDGNQGKNQQQTNWPLQFGPTCSDIAVEQVR